MSIPWPSHWPAPGATARAALITCFIAINLAFASPFPKRVVTPEKQAEGWRTADVDLWYAWVREAGVQMDRDAFEEQVLFYFNKLAVVGHAIRVPGRPLFSFQRTTQQWGLFGVVNQSPERLVIEAQLGEEWVEIYRRLGEADWRDDWFKYRRVRGVWDGVKDNKPRARYKNFTRWVARTAFQDYPEARRVRVYIERFYPTLPPAPIDPETKQLYERQHKRENHVP